MEFGTLLGKQEHLLSFKEKKFQTNYHKKNSREFSYKDESPGLFRVETTERLHVKSIPGCGIDLSRLSLTGSYVITTTPLIRATGLNENHDS